MADEQVDWVKKVMESDAGRLNPEAARKIVEEMREKGKE